MKVTVDKVNKKQFTAKGRQVNKYGICTTNQPDTWINIPDWDGLYDDKGISKGDTINITQPEKGDYGFEAKFISGPTGYSDEEVQEFDTKVIQSQLNEIMNYVKQIGAALEISLEDSDGYPNPTKGEMEAWGPGSDVDQAPDEAVDEYNDIAKEW